ncbi:haloacid dehalogenase-like hydrolase (plasmid) [Streptomyces scopuliridis]|uniref:HAD family hydrolase n=1 Tax=Streptomyces scopuliridis TaxID=452529 RepID=UPI002DD7E33C|nr:haloacid dehalogenase-like hydrolase [Streptomyces scopuliridis]WSB39027.1 haloacid dehalogenase-like hydrolase [Streptomyces scopuliridis]
MQLVLWDIDHTLIATRGVGREIFGECFEQVTGQAMHEQATVNGMTEPVIFRETAELHGIRSDRAMFEAFAACSAERHQARAGELRRRGHALQGAAAALAAVAELGGVVQSVVTGNVRPVAEIKLGVFGLATHIQWPYGGYGEDDDERPELVRIAMRRASRGLGVHIAADDVLLVGDTPADVAAGLGNGVRVLAVASGRSSVEELHAAGATRVAAGLAPHDVLHALDR